MDLPSFEKIVRVWFREEVGMRMPSGESGIYALTVLVGNVVRLTGLKEDEIRNKREKIWDIVVSNKLNNDDKKKLKEYLNNLLEYAFIDYFPPEFDIVRDVITPEIKDRIAVRKVKQIVTEKKENYKNPDTKTDPNPDSIADKYPEITEDMLTGVEAPKIIIDPDWEKQLGLDDVE
jgi:hypothetical protein